MAGTGERVAPSVAALGSAAHARRVRPPPLRRVQRSDLAPRRTGIPVRRGS
jgi:hypothetical protein